MFHLKMIYKTRPKTLLLGTILLFLYTLLANLAFNDTVTWFYIKLFIIVFPVFYTGNVISNEYEYGRSGIIFTSKTPIYMQGLTHFLSALFANCIMIIVMYLSAYVVGLEYNFWGFITLIAYASFLSVLAFTFSNLTKKNAVGYAVAILYWGLFFMAGTKANELLMPISTLININLQYDIVWYNVLSMLSFSLILLLFNIWWLGRGEGIRKTLVCISLPTTLALIILLIKLPDTSYLTRTEWHSLSQDEVQMLYQDIPGNLDSELMAIWESTYDTLVALSGEENIYNTLQISCETGLLENPQVTDKAVTLSVLRTSFNDPMQGGDDFQLSIPEAAFATHYFSQLDNYDIFKGFSKYLTYTRVLPLLYEQDNESIHSKYFYYEDAISIKNSYLESLQGYLSTHTLDNWMSEEVSGLILYAIEEKSSTGLNAFLSELSQITGTVTLDDIRVLSYQYADPTLIDQIISLYESASLVH